LYHTPVIKTVDAPDLTKVCVLHIWHPSSPMKKSQLKGSWIYIYNNNIALK
jgi:hypothetical protein